MKRFKGTGGKWGTYCDDGTHIIGTESPYHGSITIAEIRRPWGDSCSKADAQLISKAPEMLKMLIDLVDVVRMDLEENHLGFDINGVNIIHKIELLIKEATEIKR